MSHALTMAMRFAYFVLLAFVAGCGARVEPTAADPESKDAAADTGVTSSGPSPSADAGVGVTTDAATPLPTDSPTAWGAGPAVTSLDACGSSESVDKIIAHTSAPLAPFPTPVPIEIIPGGAKCEVFDARSATGEYAFAGKCGLIEMGAPITVIVREGVRSTDGRPMEPGTHVFYATRSPGRLCGTAYHEARF